MRQNWRREGEGKIRRSGRKRREGFVSRRTNVETRRRGWRPVRVRMEQRGRLHQLRVQQSRRSRLPRGSSQPGTPAATATRSPRGLNENRNIFSVLLNNSNAESLAVRGDAPSLVDLLIPRRRRKNPNKSPRTRILPARKKGNQSELNVSQLHHQHISVQAS